MNAAQLRRIGSLVLPPQHCFSVRKRFGTGFAFTSTHRLSSSLKWGELTRIAQLSNTHKLSTRHIHTRVTLAQVSQSYLSATASTRNRCILHLFIALIGSSALIALLSPLYNIPDDAPALEPTLVLTHPAPARLVAIGDVHGDYEALRTLLRRVGVIDAADRWLGGRTVLVQVGDQTDRGDGELDIYELLFRLQDEAAAAGGAVHVLLGNHEVMNVRLDFRYVTPKGFDNFTNDTPFEKAPLSPDIDRLPQHMQARASAFAPGGVLAEQLAKRTVVSVIVGDTVFVHAGLSIAHLDGAGRSGVEDLNHHTSEFLMGTRKIPRLLRGGKGPLWIRTYSMGNPRPEDYPCMMLRQVLKELGVKRMVVGHTVQEHINSRCNDGVWRIDTGMSAYYGGKPEALEIFDDGTINIITLTEVVEAKLRSY